MKLTADEVYKLVQISNDCTARRFAIEAIDYIERFKLLPMLYKENAPQYLDVNIKDIFYAVFTRMVAGSNFGKYVYNIFWANSKSYSDEDIVMTEKDLERSIDNIKKYPNLVDSSTKEMLKALHRMLTSRGFKLSKQRTGVYIKGADTDGVSLDWIDYDGTIRITWDEQD